MLIDAATCVLYLPKCSGPNDCGQQLASVKLARTPSGPRHRSGVSGVGEFADSLPAAAAGRAKPLAVADDENFRDAPSARVAPSPDRARFGACALRIGGVLDVAAGKNLALGRRVSQRRQKTSNTARRRCALAALAASNSAAALIAL